MRTEPDFPDDDRDPQKEEVARVARQLAEYGFYVMDALLPENLKTKPSHIAKRPH